MIIVEIFYCIDNFDNVFDKFIQNTFVSKSNLQLDTYESQTKGEFFDNITKNISMITEIYIHISILFIESLIKTIL